ncbi:MAG: element excision factor XisH family protein [Rivularia sp. (in: cyanobacteria)]
MYLAVPNQAYKNFFEKRFVQRMVSKYQLKLLIFDPKNEVIVEWKN